MSYTPPAGILTAPYFDPRYSPGYYVDGSHDVPIVTGVAATPGDGEVDLIWDEVVDATYTVKRSETEGGTYTELDDGLTDESYNDPTAVNSTTYYYVVIATINGVDGAPSAPISATPSA